MNRQRSNQMNLFLGEICRKLSEDPGVHREGYMIYDCIVTRCSVVTCPATSRCNILYRRCRKYGTDCWLDFNHAPACDGCAGIFSSSLPPVITFLQRRRLDSILTVDYYAKGCFYCYGRTKLVSRADSMCVTCNRAHKQEEGDLVEKMMILGEVLGADCMGVVAGLLVRM
jgi:hypothetical protein